MQLRVGFLLHFIFLVESVAFAQVDVPPRGAEASLRVYADDDHVTVITPSAAVHAPLGRGFSGDFAATVDVVTAASVDVTSQASGHAFTEHRYEGDAGVRYAAGQHVALGLRMVGSIESDYQSLRPGASLSLDLRDHTTFIDAEYTAIIDVVGRAGDPLFARDRDGHRLVLSLSQVIGPRTIVDLVLDGERLTGYQSNPYRFVPIYGADGGGVLYSLDEKTPDERLRGAALIRLRQAFGHRHRFFVHADYRFYGDDWRVMSHTASARGIVPLLDGRLTLSAEVRGYLQNAAWFYREQYVDNGSGAPGWRTRDRALGRVRSLSAGSVADFTLFELFGQRPHAVLGVDLIQFWWLDYLPQSERRALLVNASVVVPF